jgi:hypothetical protein
MQGFRVSSILMAGKDRIFYVVFAGEGSGAVSYTARDFFALLVGTDQIFCRIKLSDRESELPHPSRRSTRKVQPR